jgi:hypothetical protein
MVASFGVVSVLVTIGLIVVAVNEFRGRQQVLRLNPNGLKLMGWNQAFFMSMIVAYCVWALYTNLTGPNQFDVAQADPDARMLIEQSFSKEQLDILKDGWPLFVCSIYVPVIILTLVFQGGMPSIISAVVACWRNTWLRRRSGSCKCNVPSHRTYASYRSYRSRGRTLNQLVNCYRTAIGLPAIQWRLSIAVVKR